jgi:hypothetical protein
MPTEPNAEPFSSQKRAAQHVPPADLVPNNGLDHMVHALAEIEKLINHTLTSLTWIEQELSQPLLQQPVGKVSKQDIEVLKLAITGQTRLRMASSLTQRVLATAQAARSRTLTADDVVLILRWLTAYPSQSITHTEAARAEELLQTMGGPQVVQERLQQIAQQWQQLYPLHSEALQKFLAGWKRREIVQHIVGQGCYEDSRVYACIKELPKRISEHLRRAQLINQDRFNAS